MKTPRLALLAIWSLLASTVAATEPGWTPKVQPGEAWTAVTFESEAKAPKNYWFRSDAKGDAIPLYTLTVKPNPSVKGSIYYESVASGYILKIVPSPRSYVILRPGTKLTYAGTPAGSLGASAWDITHKPTYRPGGTTRTNPYPGGTITVVVAAPTGAAEKLDPTPISVFTPGLAPVTWKEYYFVRPVENHWSDGIYDRDGDYRKSKLNYGEMHARVIPFEYLFNSENSFVLPESCAAKKDKGCLSVMEAASEAAKGNLLLIEPLAIAGHKYYAEEARKFKAELDNAPANQFSESENKFLQRLLVDNGVLPAFQTELRGLKPEQQPQFVAKWRGYLKTEIDAYLAESAKAGDKPVNNVALRGAMTARINAAAAQKLGAAPVVKPGTGKPGAGKPGTGKPGAPAERLLVKKPEAKLWNGTVTPIGKWFEIKTKTMPVPGAADISPLAFYCYHDKLGTHKKLKPHLDKFPLIVECVDWSVPKGDATAGDAKGKYKARDAKIQFNVAVPVLGGELQVVDDKGVVVAAGGAVTEIKQMAAADIGGAAFVKVTAAAQIDAPIALLLSTTEQIWLDKTEANAYNTAIPTEPAARMTHVDKFRGVIINNLDTKTDAITAYSAAIDKKHKLEAAKIDETLPAVWGGKDNKTIVELFGPNEDVQLSEADYKALEKLPAAEPKGLTPVQIYANARSMATGRGKAGSSFNPDLYDPIVLHRTVKAARKALGKPDGSTVTTPPKPAGPDMVDLTPEQIALLTPDEKAKYLAQQKLAKEANASAKTKEALYQMNADLKAAIKDRKPYAKPTSEAAFKGLDVAQKKLFCDGLPSAASVAEKTRKDDFEGNQGANANSGLGKEAGKGTVAPGATTDATVKAPAAGKEWTAEEALAACNAFKKELALNPGEQKPADKKDAPTVTAKEVVPGPDKNEPDKKENKWLTAPLIASASKGALIGLIIGSLFGPVGLIAGPLISGAMFYGLDKHAADSKKDE